ncbi:MAG: GAF domain-containing protein [Pyrinomonadaceae bacterium]|nr:GAF domain-containing protein [Pyrinomonadaceae bacterium]
MKSEELEISLRTEFENYLKNVLADMKQEVTQLQEKIEVEAEKHKSQLEEVFKNALYRVESDVKLDDGFKEAVVEHLRLAKDEGARITVTAMEEAEQLERPQVSGQSISDFSLKMRDAINDISGKQSQAEILKTLIHHCEEFTPRGAFFIIKNEHFVGWRTFGKDRGETEEVIREVFFPTSEQSLLSEANKFGVVVSNSTAKGKDESLYLEKLGFSKSEKMYAVPLVVRGRGVAVLYADSGENFSPINIEAIESLAKVASLTVELLASSKAGSSRSVSEEKSETGPLTPTTFIPTPTAPIEEKPQQFVEEKKVQQPVEFETIAKPESSPFEEVTPIVTPAKVEVEEVSTTPFEVERIDTTPVYETESFVQDDSNIETVSTKTEDFAFTTESWGKPKVEVEDYSSSVSTVDSFVSEESVSFKPTAEYEFETTQFNEPVKTDTFDSFTIPKSDNFDSFSYSNSNIETESFAKNEVSSFKEEINSFEPATPSFDKTSFDTPFEAESQPVVEEIVKPVATAPVKSRFSDKNVDLPIDVAEDERRLHNDARRFARLLVSEIKLYNEQKVKEGRDSNDLYERLREAIDRSREMYDKRVQPPVAQKFDYFHFELINTLAEGEEAKLGSSYPGATV